MQLVLLWTSLLSVCCQELVFVGDVEGEDSKVEEATVAEEPPRERFVATNEWQEIKPGQAIPQGLHVRMDMQTGKKEARLMQVQIEPNIQFCNDIITTRMTRLRSSENRGYWNRSRTSRMI